MPKSADARCCSYEDITTITPMCMYTITSKSCGGATGSHQGCTDRFAVPDQEVLTETDQNTPKEIG